MELYVIKQNFMNASKNLDKDIEYSLERLGLDPKESAVYCALLRLGTVGTSHLLDATGLHGQYVYQALARLEERGLAAHAIVRGRKKFHANPSMCSSCWPKRAELRNRFVWRKMS